ncbi:hypothetical protein B0H19DRAFT_1260763 [Mycena capillaripes]|nr:hypothetical protein B0H19DRAFT_1260763 [Mycena capillaripes]
MLGRSARPGQQKFQHVTFSVRLVNSYISVHYQHSSLEASEALFWQVFDDVGVVPDARSSSTAGVIVLLPGLKKNGKKSEVCASNWSAIWCPTSKMDQNDQDVGPNILGGELLPDASS